MKARAIAITLVAVAVLLGAFAVKAAFDAHVASIEISLAEGPVVGTQLFFAADGGFSERNSAVLQEQAPAWRMRVPSAEVGTLRLDPPVDAVVSVCRLDIMAGDQRRSLKDYRVTGFHQVAAYTYADGCLVVEPIAGGVDPQLQLELLPDRMLSPDRRWAWGFGLAALLFAAAARISMRGRRRPKVAGVLADRLAGRLVPVYVLLSLAFGSLYALVTPPGAVTDEYAHVTKAVKVSEGVLVGDTGERLFADVFEMYGRFNGYLDPSVHFSTAQLLTQIETPVPCEPSTAALPGGADSYAPHLYVAPAASYAFSCATGQDTGTFLLLARLGNLFIATLLIAAGLWATLRARWALFVCALLPMTVYQIASVSADAMYLALSFAWIGAVCGVMEERVPTAKAIWVLGPLAVMLAISKPGAAWVLIAILFARPVYLRTVGTFTPALLKYLVVPFIVHLLWVLYSAGSANPLDGVDPAANLSRFIGEPLGVAKVFVQTFTGSHGIWLWKSSLGVLGWLDVYLSIWSYAGLTLCLVASLWMGASKEAPGPWVSSGALLFSAGAAAMLALPLFIFWTFPQSPIVMGLQGRYFLPCVAFAVCFLARGADPRLRALLSAVVPLVLMLALADGLIALVERYYP